MGNTHLPSLSSIKATFVRETPHGAKIIFDDFVKRGAGNILRVPEG